MLTMVNKIGFLTKFQKSRSTSSSVMDGGPEGCPLPIGVDVTTGSLEVKSLLLLLLLLTQPRLAARLKRCFRSVAD